MSARNVTFDVTEGQLVKYFHDRPEGAAPVEDRAGCLELLGFTEWSTGGGCMALFLEMSSHDDRYLLVTGAEDGGIPTDDEPALVGAYRHAGGMNEDEDVFGGLEGEVFPTESNAVLYERIITWLGCPSRTMAAASANGPLNPEALAAEFTRVLREWLTEEQMREVVKRNATVRYAGCCASHDFCDANMAMLEACAKLTGKPETEHDFADEALCAIVNRAWDLARASGFSP